MRVSLSVLFLYLLAVLATWQYAPVAAEAVAQEDAGAVKEETVEAVPKDDDTVYMTPEDEDPELTQEEFKEILTQISKRCAKEVEENPQDPSQLSRHCFGEVTHNVQKKIAEKAGRPFEEEEAAYKRRQKKGKKKGKKGGKKTSRAAREAAAAQKKQDEENEALKVILGFVGTLVAVIVGAVMLINRKLKQAGMYYPADPDAKATGCCG